MIEQSRAGARVYAKHPTPARRWAAPWGAARLRLRVSGYAAGVTLIWLLHAAVNLRWLWLDTRPPTFDAARHAVWALHVARQPFASQPLDALLGALAPHPYPPLVYWASAPLLFFSQRTGLAPADVMAASQLLFLGLLFCATYQLGKELGEGNRGRQIGLGAVLLLSLYPIVYGLSRFYLLDLAQMALTALALWLLLRVHRFERLGPSLALGAALALGMLTKWTFAAVLAAPLLLVIADALWPRPGTTQERWRRRARNVLSTLLFGLLLVLPWYALHLADLTGFLQRWSNGPVSETITWADRWTGDGRSAAATRSRAELLSRWWRKSPWVYYTRGFILEQVTLPLALLCLAALVRLRGSLRRWPVQLVLLSIIAPCLIFASISIKDIRYTSPVLPAVALLSALGWSTVERWMGRVLLTLLVGLALLLFVQTSTGLLRPLPDPIEARLLAVSSRLYREALPAPLAGRAEDWRVDEIVLNMGQMLADAPTAPGASAAEPGASAAELGASAAEPAAQVLVLPAVAHYEEATFWYAINERKLPLEVLMVARGAPHSADEQVARSEFIVTKTGGLGNTRQVADGQALDEALRDPHSTLAQHFRRSASYPLPDGSTGELYVRVAQ